MILKSMTVISLAAAVLLSLGGPVWFFPLYLIGCFAALLVLAVAVLLIACALVDMEKPMARESKFYRRLMYPYIELVMRLVGIRLRTEGLEKVPAEGRFLLVCNHQNAADPGVILHCLPKAELTFVSKQENKKLPVINKFMHCIRCQFIDRDNDRQALRAIINCIQMIKSDEVSVAVFPEGYTSRDGKLHHFRSGVFKIALKTGVPIVVCTINGTGPLFSNIKRLKPTPVRFCVVDVIPPEDLAGLNTTRIADRIYEAMLSDLGEEYRCAPEHALS